MPTSSIDFGSNSTPDFWSNIDWSKINTSNLDTQPALTNASSGTISEIDDLPRMEDVGILDTQYQTDSQTQLQNFDFGNDFSEAGSYGGNYSSVNSNSSNRWSMPAFSSQVINNVFPMVSTESPVKEVSGQSFGMAQPATQNQNAMISGSSSAQSHSPVADGNMYEGKNSEFSGFDWSQFIPEYGNSVVPSDDGSMINFAVSESGQNASTVADMSSLSSNNSNFEGFDNSFRTMQWDDGVSMPADQDFLGSYSLDPNWSTGDFNSPWS